MMQRIVYLVVTAALFYLADFSYEARTNQAKSQANQPKIFYNINASHNYNADMNSSAMGNDNVEDLLPTDYSEELEN